MLDKSKKIVVFAFTILLITIWVILFRHENRVWDFVAGLLLASGVLPILWALLEKESDKLNLGIMLLVLLGIAWLVWVGNVSVLIVLPILLLALVAVKWTLSSRTKPARLLGFFVKTFTLFLIGTGIAYFIWLKFTMPAYLSFRFQIELEYGMILFVIPISLLLESISVIIYGIFKTEMKPWQIFLSSFYVSVIAVWILMPHTQASPYSSFAGGLGEFLSSLFQSLFFAGIIAGILTIVYGYLGNQQKKRLWKHTRNEEIIKRLCPFVCWWLDNDSLRADAGNSNMYGIVDAKDLYILSRNYGKTFNLLSLTGIIAIAGIQTYKTKKKQPKQPSYIN